MLLIMTVVHICHTKQLDYMIAFPRDPVEKYLYMKKGIRLDSKDSNDCALKLQRTYMVRKIPEEYGINI